MWPAERASGRTWRWGRAACSSRMPWSRRSAGSVSTPSSGPVSTSPMTQPSAITPSLQRPSLWLGWRMFVCEWAWVFGRVFVMAVPRAGGHYSYDAGDWGPADVAPRVTWAGSGGGESHWFGGVRSTLRDNVSRGGSGVGGAGAVVSRSTQADGHYGGGPAW